VSTNFSRIVDQVAALLELHHVFVYSAGNVGILPGMPLDAETAAAIAGTLVDFLAVLATDEARSSAVAELRSHVVRKQAERRTAEGLRQLRVMNTIGWLERQFWDRREWPNEELFAAAHEEGIANGSLFDREIKSLPIRRKRITTATGHCDWIWIAKASWPEGNTRPRGHAVRRKKREG
jgi:hypothetical protein